MEFKCTREDAQLMFKRSQTYQGVYACNNSIHNEHEEDLIVRMAHTIVHPIAMVVLNSRVNYLIHYTRYLG